MHRASGDAAVTDRVHIPNPSVHATPEIAAVCPYCHPERMAAKAQRAQAERREVFTGTLKAGRGLIEAADAGTARFHEIMVSSGPIHHTTGRALQPPPPSPRKRSSGSGIEGP